VTSNMGSSDRLLSTPGVGEDREGGRGEEVREPLASAAAGCVLDFFSVRPGMLESLLDDGWERLDMMPWVVVLLACGMC
jgi:hypothetical protein